MKKVLLSAALVLGTSVATADQFNYPQPEQGYGPPSNGPGYDDERYYQPGEARQVQGGQGNIQIGDGSTVIIQVDPRGNRVRQAFMNDACDNDDCYGGLDREDIGWQDYAPTDLYGWGCDARCVSNRGLDSYFWVGGQRLPLYNTYRDQLGYQYYVYNRFGRGVPRYQGYNPVPPRMGNWARTPGYHPYMRMGQRPQKYYGPRHGRRLR